ncbi:MAG TPA: 50S ribosomal protein L10 [Fimbriimonadaceae bacterium]|nr:50S ribosomal protein L10 [Fimbriimonadaceae bacterium]HRJ96459.1 50S ribosomal protein L10 [Fimbriimonadaceae bacterium]
MPTAEKAKNIEQARDWYQRSKGVIFTDYRGLKVKEMQQLRAELAKKGGEIHVIKNTLFRLAAGDEANVIDLEFHSGPTAVAFLFDNETECTKALFDYAATHKAFKVKGAFVGGKLMDAKQTEAFSKLPPRDVLLAQVIGAIAAPLTNLVGVIEALYADPIRTIGAVADKVAEGSPAPASEPAPATADVVQEAPAAETPAEEAVAGSAAEAPAETPSEPAAEEAPSDAPAETPAEEQTPPEAESEEPNG